MHDEKFDQQRGGLKEVGGKVEKAAGDISGNHDLENDGRKHETEGKAQGIFGKAKNAIGDAVDNVKDSVDPNNKDAMVDGSARTSRVDDHGHTHHNH